MLFSNFANTPKSFKQLDSAFADLTSMHVQRFVGDVAMQGNGEILFFELALPISSVS